MIAVGDFYGANGPLRRETFRDPNEAQFEARVAALLAKALFRIQTRVPGLASSGKNIDDALEALTLNLAYEQAASIWTSLPVEEGVAGEVSSKYLQPEELRKEAAFYAHRYARLLEALLDTPVDPSERRSGRLRRV